MNIDQEELETWLAEVELVSQKVKDLTKPGLDIQDFDKREQQERKKKELKKQQEEERERQKRMEEYERRKQGKPGKGNDKNYHSFCKVCFWEYELPTPECLRCKKPTQTQEERMQYLLKRVDEYKTNKTKKEERKKKWELWKKTEAMLWKKNTTNYSKWDFYVSDSESEKEDDPIVPKDDPNFKALEQDIQQRAKKKNEDRIKAENLKEKANECMKQQDYKKAAEIYSEALEIVKDMKCLWTNRALAYIKLKKYTKAVEDCTRVIDYCDCFEEGFTKSREFAYKAFFRRSLARKEKKDYKLALEDAEQAIKLYPNDSQIIQLKQEIQFIIKHKEEASKILQKINVENKENYEVINKKEESTKKENDMTDKPIPLNEKINEQEVQENNSTNQSQENQNESQENQNKPQENQNQSQEKQNQGKETQQQQQQEKPQELRKDLPYQDYIQLFFKKDAKDNTEEELQLLSEYLNKNEEAKIYFFEKRGTARLENLFRENKRNTYLVANTLIHNNILYQDQFLKNDCHTLILEKLCEISKKPLTFESISEIEDCLEVLITLSVQDKSRNTLISCKNTLTTITNLWPVLLPHFHQEVSTLSNFLIFVSNMCYNKSQVKVYLGQNLNMILNDLNNIIRYESKKMSIENLRENSFNLLANLLTEENLRKEFAENKYTQLLENVLLKISQYDILTNPMYLKPAEAALNVFVNVSFQCGEEIQKILKDMKIEIVLFGRFWRLSIKQNQDYEDIYSKCLQILAKLDYSESSEGFLQKIFDSTLNLYQYEKLQGHLIRLYANLSQNKNVIEKIKNNKKIDFEGISKELVKIINQQNQDDTKFCNACNTAGFINEFKQELLPLYRNAIPRLIAICRDKLGITRKNAAIFLAKLCKNQSNLEAVRALHGIEILHSIIGQVVQK